jgi:hypothetical protein
MTRDSTILDVRPENPVPDEFDVLCEKCAYSLVGLTCDRCPECGHPFDHTELPLARVPWLYRRRIGSRRAYAQTWRMILLHPSQFAGELCRPVRISQQDAKLFRRRTIRRTLLAASLVAGFGIGWILWQEARGGALPSSLAEPRPYAFLLAGYLGGIVALWTFLTLATDLPTFIWQGLDRTPDDLAPLHHYASAPLAITPYAIVLVTLVGLFAGDADHGWRFYLVLATIAISTITLVLALWRIPQLLLRAGANCSPRQSRALALYLPVHWTIIMVLSGLIFCLFIIPPMWYFSD